MNMIAAGVCAVYVCIAVGVYSIVIRIVVGLLLAGYHLEL